MEQRLSNFGAWESLASTRNMIGNLTEERLIWWRGSHHYILVDTGGILVEPRGTFYSLGDVIIIR